MCSRTSTSRNAVPRKCGTDTTATASFIPAKFASSGVSLLPIPNPETTAIAPATIAVAKIRRSCVIALGYDSRPESSSNLFRHDVGWAVAAAKQAIGFLVADDLLLRGIESQRTPKAV